MKKILTISFIICFFFQSAPAMNTPSFSTGTSLVLKTPADILNLSTLKIREAERLLGRKMKLKEKIAFKLFQWKLKKELKSNKGESRTDLGKTSMILGIIGIGLMLVPYLVIAAIPCAILAIVFGNKARKENRDDRKALTGIILGWITIGIFVVALALLLVFLASWSGWGWG